MTAIQELKQTLQTNLTLVRRALAAQKEYRGMEAQIKISDRTNEWLAKFESEGATMKVRKMHAKIERMKLSWKRKYVQ
jgi:hypothetical protein